MIQSVAGSNTLKQKSDEAFKELCSEKHIARLYRTQVDYLLANWTEYDISRPDAEISDGRAILRILADDWKECLELYRKGEIKADRILLEKPVHQSLKRKNPFKKIAFIAYNAKKFFSSCFCPPASFTSRIDTKGGPRGLVNEGNDCFFNSLFQQIVWGDPVFREALCKKHPILAEYITAYEADEPMSLNPLREYLAHLSHDDSWCQGQHDPHEAMVVLTSDWKENPHQMEISSKKIYSASRISKQIPSDSLSIACPLPVPTKAGKSPVPFVALLQNFQNILFPPAKDAYVTYKGMDLFLRKEINHLQRPKDHLTFQITRASKEGVKSHTLIDIPKRISLDPNYFVEKPQKSVSYELTGFITHKGSSSKSGHYVAYVSEPTENGRRYFVCNDSEVTPLTEQEFLKAAQSAYIVYFQKIT